MSLGKNSSSAWGSAIAAVGFYLPAGKLTDLSLGAQTLDIMIAGAGLGLILGVASTDAGGVRGGGGAKPGRARHLTNRRWRARLRP